MNEIKDYYKKLNCTINSSYRDIYLNFKNLAFPLHPDNPNSQRNDNLFKEYCEAYYVLEYREFRIFYNEIYRRFFLHESIVLNEDEIIKSLNAWTKNGLELSESYLKMSFKIFKKKVPVKETWLAAILGDIIRLICEIFP